MATTSSVSIEHLPVEIVHRIFDHLDAQTILYSIRPVCRSFRSIVNSYDRYKFDFQMISKCNFHRLCRLIQPQHLISLTLYHNEQIPDQISFFMSNYRLRQLTRLHSLNLFGIDEVQLDLILKQINLSRLSSFSLHIQKYDDRRRKTTSHYLSLIMAQPTLRKVELNIKSDRIFSIKWPLNCRIESLIINEDIFIDDLIPIFACSPRLHRLILKQSSLNLIANIIPKSSFVQLTSLTFEALDMSINQLEAFLLFTPSLTYLKLISGGCEYDGKRWEEFIQVNLPNLDKFEFFTSFRRLTHQTRDDLQLILQSFQSPFWIEHKKWLIACEFDLKQTSRIHIYSIPICKSRFQYEFDSEKCFLSTSNNLLLTKNITELVLSLKLSIDNDIFQRTNTSFPYVTKLSIDLTRKISINVVNYLPSIIDISQIIEVKFESYSFGKDNQNLLFNLIKLIQSSSKLSSLIIHSRFYKYELYPYLNDLCSILPPQIRSLQIPIHQLEQIEMIFARCQDLSVLKFEITRAKFSAEVRQWFEEKMTDSTFERHNGCDCIWIGKKRNRINENPKRIKLMDEQSK